MKRKHKRTHMLTTILNAKAVGNKVKQQNYNKLNRQQQQRLRICNRLKPRAGSGVVRIDPLRFLAGCRTR